ncbi:MAG: mannose-6-phosphate isomerase, class I [Saprospiraceae bacterium]
MNTTDAILIRPAIQHYAWGGKSYIPSWLHNSNKDSRPFAEAWFGDHPLAPAIVHGDHFNEPLNHWITKDPSGILGRESIDIYGPRMPFLLKILDVHDMLSLQLHPTKQAAEYGYNREHDLQIPVDAPHRNYKDQNHKPEILFALSDFWMLQGFAPIEEILYRFKSLIPEFAISLNPGWQSLMQAIWDLSGDSYLDYSKALFNNLSDKNLSDKNQIYHWLSKAFKLYPPSLESNDRGLLVMLLLKVQYLKPGQVGYQAPGVIHAYLEGQNVELMANSDNVLRGGLTPKHIDPAELIKHLDTDTSGQCLIKPMYLMDDEVAFNPPVNDFLLKHFKVKKGGIKFIQFNTVSVILIKEGNLNFENKMHGKGDSIFIPAYKQIQIETVSDTSEYFLATSTL